MLLTITTTYIPATDLGYLLHKNPSRFQSFNLSFGKAHVFYPEASEKRCTAALLLDIDPIGMVRDRRGPSGEGGSLEQYVNDRPYVASSFLSVAISEVFGTAISGRCKDRPQLAELPIPLIAKLSAVPCRGGEVFLRKLFEPLGYRVDASFEQLDEKFPDWGLSRYANVTLENEVRLSDLLKHLYVLIPVLDDDKHYWVGEDEVEKLLRHASEWLGAHPERAQIASRYLKRRRKLVREALERLVEEPDPDAAQLQHSNEEERLEEKLSLNEERIGTVIASIKSTGAKRVLDLGCGSGKLLRRLLEDRSIEQITGVDVSFSVLEAARDHLQLDRLPEVQKSRLSLMQGSLMYRDRRMDGYDCATAIEVIEHLDLHRLSAFERVLFEFARPTFVILTTPNLEYNSRFESLPAGKLRHKDHRFEWSRSEFQNWAGTVSARFGYNVRFLPIGPIDPDLGSPTQMAVFSRT